LSELSCFIPYANIVVMKLTFFHQKRQDQAVRAGIEVDDELMAEKFIPGLPDHNSALLWYVDLRCAIDQPAPTDLGNARALLLDIGEPVQRTLFSVADELSAGLDSDLWPLRRVVPSLPAGIRAEVVCSAMRRVADGELSQAVRELAQNWQVMINEMPEPEFMAR
jgi:hypothetical protein